MLPAVSLCLVIYEVGVAIPSSQNCEESIIHTFLKSLKQDLAERETREGGRATAHGISEPLCLQSCPEPHSWTDS